MLRQHIVFALLLHVFAMAFLATTGSAAEVDISSTSKLSADEYADLAIQDSNGPRNASKPESISLAQTVAPVTKSTNLKPNKPFVIVSQMHGHRVLYWMRNIGNGQLIVGIRKPRYTHHELFKYDPNTGHIRLASNSNYVLAVQRGVNRRGAHLVLRAGNIHHSDQKWDYKPKAYHNWSPFSNKGLCMDVAGGRDVDAQHVIMWNCHNGANQRFEVDYNIQKKLVKSTNLQPNKPFFIQSRMSGGRVLYLAEKLDKDQHQIKIRKPQHQWQEMWFYDPNSGHVKNWKMKELALALQKGHNNRGARIVVRKAEEADDQKWWYRPNTYHNWSPFSNKGLCIDIWQNKDVDQQHLVAWSCHNGANQRFDVNYNTAKKLVKSTGLRPYSPFLIRSKMQEGRVLYWKNQIGGGQYQMAIRKPRYSKEEIYFFDPKSGYIRNYQDKNFILSVQKGQNNRGAKLVLRSASGTDDQKWQYSPGQYHNWSPFSNKGLCIDVSGSQNRDGQDVHMWSCHNGANQRFEADYKTTKPIYKSTNLKAGQPFFIRSNMGGRRVIYYGRDIGGGQYECLLRTPEYSKEEIFVFDGRTGHIRNFYKRELALGVQKGKNGRGARLVVRKAEDSDEMKWKYQPGRNQVHNWNPFSNHGLTIDAAHGDRDGSVVHMWTWHNGWNQRFDADYNVQKPKYISSGLVSEKPFFIRSRMGGGRVLYKTNHDLGGKQFATAIRMPHFSNEEIFVFDSKTGHIRLASERGMVLAVQRGNNNRGARLVIRREEWSNTQAFHYKANGLHNWTPFSNSGLCIDAAQGDRDGSVVHMWTHHNGWNQRWEADYNTKKPVYKPQTTIKTNRPFFIQTHMKGQRVLYSGRDLGGKQFEIKTRIKQYNSDEMFFYDNKFGYIRSWKNKNMVLSVIRGQNNRGARLVLREAANGDDQKWMYNPGQPHNIVPFSNKGLCIDAANGDIENSIVHMWTHHNGQNQKWLINYNINRPIFQSQGFKPNAPFMIKSRMNDGRVLYFKRHIGQSVYIMGIRKPLYNHQEIFAYDPKTGHIRMFNHRQHVLAIQPGQSHRRGAHLVIRPQQGGKDEAWVYKANQYHNWSPLINNMCIDVSGGRNVDGQEVIMWSCHNGANQRFEVDYSTTRPQYKSTNVKPGQPFFIRSVMGGHRVLYFDNNIGNQQFQIKLRSPRYDDKEIWVFDPISGHIRNRQHREWVLGVQHGNNNRGAKLVLRKASNDKTTHWKYTPKSAHNWSPFSNSGLCIDSAHGDRDGSIVHMWTHHNGQNQMFEADYNVEMPLQKSTGLKANKPFLIQSAMGGNRVMFMNRHIGGGQHEIALRKPKYDAHEIWFYDDKTGHIRLFHQKNMVLSIQKGNNNRGARVVARAAEMRSKDQAWHYKKGAYHNWNPFSRAELTMDAAQGDRDGSFIHMWTFHNGQNQRFEANYNVNKPQWKNTGTIKANTPFWIQSRGAGKRVLTFGRDLGGQNFETHMKSVDYNQDTMWIFDEKTGYIRSFKNRNLVLGFQRGRAGRGTRLVAQHASGSNYQKWIYHPNQFHNWVTFGDPSLCIDAANGDRDGSVVHMWTHHNGWNQRWEINYNVQKPLYKSTNLKAHTPFMIQSNMAEGRVLYWTQHIGGGQWGMAIRKPQYSREEIWFYDPKTGHIRNFQEKDWVIGVQNGNNNRGARLVCVKAQWNPSQKWDYKPKAYHNWSPFSNKGLCIDVSGGQNRDGQTVILWSCHNGANQRFEVTYSVTKPLYKSTNLVAGKPFFIRSRMPGGRVLFIGAKIAGNQYEMAIHKAEYAANEIFVFDPISGHIRNHKNRNLAISVQKGNNNRGARLVARSAEHDPSQKWKYNPDQKAAHNWTPFSNSGLVIDVAQGDRDGSIVHMWTAHNGMNQRFDADYNIKKPMYKSTGLTADKPFLIQSKMSGKRVLYYSKNIGNGQYEMAIRKPLYDEREIYYYDAKTGHIRNFKHKNWVISVQKGNNNQRGARLVLRTEEWSQDQAFRYLHGQHHNWSPLSNFNLAWDVSGGNDNDGAFVHLWSFHNGLNQMFEVNYETQKPRFFSTNLKPNKPFMIKSNMADGRVLFWTVHIGGGQWGMAIRKPHYSKEEIWYYDPKTGHIRNQKDKEWVIAVENGKDSRGAKLVCVKEKWDPSQKWWYRPGQQHNWSPFSNKGLCMDVAGAQNKDNQPVIMWSCHNGQNQRFEVTYSVTKPVYKSTNIKPDKPFMIQSKMHGGRVLFWNNYIGGGMYQMQIRKPQYDNREIYYFDPITGHIKNKHEPLWVIGVQRGNNNRGALLVLIRAEQNPSQKWKYSPGHYHNWSPFSNNGLCMDVYYGRDQENQKVIVWSCHNGMNQRFEVNYNVKKPLFKSTGLLSGKAFMIQSKMQDGRVLYFGRKIAGDQYEMAIRKPLYDDKEIFFFDEKSGHIRNFKHKNWVIGVEKGKDARGATVVLRREEWSPDQKWNYQPGKVHNWIPFSNSGLCMDVSGGQNKDGARVIVWSHHNGQNQQFEANYKVTKPIYKSTHLKAGKDFMIESRMKDGRVLYWQHNIGGDQYKVQIRKPQYDDVEKWFFDPISGHIRSKHSKNMVLGVEKGKNQRGAKLVVRKLEDTNEEKFAYTPGQFHNWSPFSNKGLCIDVSGAQNKDGADVIFWQCHNGDNQRFEAQYKTDKPLYKSTGLKPNTPFMIKSVMHGGRVIYFGKQFQTGQFQAAIRQPKYTKEELMYFDPQTGHIRSQHNPKFALSVHKGNSNRGAHVVFRNSEWSPDQKWKYSKNQYHNWTPFSSDFCMDVAGGRDREDEIIIMWQCHNGANQRFEVTYKVSKPLYKSTNLKANKPFFIKSAGNGGRVLYNTNKKINGNQYEIAIRKPQYNSNEYFYFDPLTGHIRSSAMNKWVLAVEKGKNSKGTRLVLRQEEHDPSQKWKYNPGQSHNWNPFSNEKLTIDIPFARDADGQYVHLWEHHGGWNQKFEADYSIEKPKIQSTGIVAGKPFMIVSKMHGGRVLYRAGHIGNNQYEVAIRKPQYTKHEIFFFDPVSGHIRNMHDKTFALGIQQGNQNRGARVVLRRAEWHADMKWNYRPGQFHNWNPISNKGLCMDVYWGKDVDGQRVIVWSCHNGANQRFDVNYNTQKPMFKSTGLKPGKPFFIRSRMADARVLFWDKQIGGDQFEMAIRKPQYTKHEMYVFDEKTGHVRNFHDRQMVIAVERGRNNQGAKLVLRKAEWSPDQKWNYKRNQYHNWSPFSNSGLCIDVAGGRNSDNTRVIMWGCHNGMNQRFEASYDVIKPIYKSTNLHPGRPFFIQSKMGEKRVLAWGKSLGSDQYQIVIRKPQYTKEEIFTFDPKSGHIRSTKDSNYAIAVQAGKKDRGAALVLRKAIHNPDQKWRYRPGQYHNWSPFSNDGLCMDVYFGRDQENQNVIVWSCHNGINQRFEANYNVKKPLFISTNLRKDKPFMIKSIMHGGRVLFWDKPIGNGQFGVSIRTPHYEKEEIFVFDDKTGHVRNAANRNFVLAVQQGNNNRGARLVMRQALHDPSQKWKYTPRNYHNWTPFSNNGLCIDVSGAQNKDGQAVILWSCHNGENQRFEASYSVVRPEIRSSIKTGKSFFIRSKMGGGRVLAVDSSKLIASGQYRVIIRKPLYTKYELFTFNKDNGLITLASDPNWFLSIQNEKGKGSRIVFQHGKTKTDKSLWKFHWKYTPGAVHNWETSWTSGLCMDVAGGRDSDMSEVIVWTCHNGMNQRFEPDYNVQKPVYASTGITPNKPFMIFSRMNGNRVLTYNPYDRSMGKQAFPVVIRKPQYNDQELWIFDPKDGKIKLFHHRRWCLTIQNRHNHRGARLVVQENAIEETSPFQAWTYKSNQYHNWSPLSNNRLCIDVWQAKNQDNQPIVVWDCHNGANQRFDITFKVSRPVFKSTNLKVGQPFFIKSKMNGDRVLFLSDHILNKQRQEHVVQIRKPKYDSREIWMFDGATGEIYLRSNRNMILAIETGSNARGGRIVVIQRQFRSNSNDSKWKYSPGQYHNWSPYSNNGLCMDVYGGRDQDNNQVITWSCHNGANQRFEAHYDVAKPLFKSTNIKPNKPFFIQSHMNDGRVLYFQNPIGNNKLGKMFNIAIRKPQYTSHEMFIFDAKTGHIRSALSKDYVLGVESGKDSRGARLVLLKEEWDPSQKWDYKPNHFHNWSPFSNKGLCIDVSGGQNRDGQAVIMWSCHNGANQRFEVNYNVIRPIFKSTNLKPYVPFMIHSRMSGGRVLYKQGSIGAGQFGVGIRDPQYDHNEIFEFDSKTGHIKLKNSKGLALAVEKGKNDRGAKLVLRAVEAKPDQKWKYAPNHFHNWSPFSNNGLCLDSSGGKNQNGNPIILWSCHNGQNQRFDVSYKVTKPVIRSTGFTSSKPFMIQSRMNGGRVLFYYNNDMGGEQFQMGIRKPQYTKHEIFFYDGKTGHIRNVKDPQFVIALQKGNRNRGTKIVLRREENEIDQKWNYRPNQYHNWQTLANKNLCIDVWQGKDEENQHLVAWACHNGANQRFDLNFNIQKPLYKSTNIQEGKKFMIYSRMKDNRVLYMDKHIGNNQFQVSIRKPQYTKEEIFTFDKKTGHIRLAKDLSLVLAVQQGMDKRGARLVLRKAEWSPTQKWWYRPAQVHNWSPFSDKGLCMDVSGGQNKDGQPVILWSCHNGANQRFEVNYQTTKPVAPVKHENFTPCKLFFIRSKFGNLAWYVTNESSYLLPTERYIKLRNPKNNDEEKFYYDAKTHSIKSFLYKDYIVTTKKQDSGPVVIVYGPHTMSHEKRYDVFTFENSKHIVDKQSKFRLEPMSGQVADGVFIAANKATNKGSQDWTLHYTKEMCTAKPKMEQKPIDNLVGHDAWGSSGFTAQREFVIRSRQGQRTVFVDAKDGFALKMHKSTNGAEERFFFDKHTGLIHSSKYPDYAIDSDKGNKVWAHHFKGKVVDQEGAVLAKFGNNIGLMTNKLKVMTAKNADGAKVSFQEWAPSKGNGEQDWNIQYVGNARKQAPQHFGK